MDQINSQILANGKPSIQEIEANLEDPKKSPLTPVGFWREQSGGIFPSIHDALTDELTPQEADAVRAYLESAPVCVASPGMVKSVMGGDDWAGTSSLRTDGIWIWPDTFSYYFGQMKIALPGRFLSHIRDRAYQAPMEAEIEISLLQFPW